MDQRRRVGRLKLLTLLLALAVLGVMLLRLDGGLPALTEPIVSEPTPDPVESPVASRAQRLLPTEVLLTPQFELTLTPRGPAGPADTWSGAVLEHVLPTLAEPVTDGEGAAWWRSGTRSGELSISGSTLLLGGQPLPVDDVRLLDVLAPNRADPDHLDRYGRIAWEGDALRLTAVDTQTGGEAHWLLSQGQPSEALAALVREARSRDSVLTAAYTETLEREASLVLLAAPRSDAPTRTPQPTSTALPWPTRTPTPTSAPTPTRVPEEYMGQIIGEQLAPVIEAADSFAPEAVQTYGSRHPWTGLLTWTEAGPQIGGLPVVVADTQELGFYSLQAGDPGGTVERFLLVTYDGRVTRFPEQQVIFMEHRMSEVLYWVVRDAAMQGGQLVVAFDDFGARQAITVLSFRPYNSTR